MLPSPRAQAPMAPVDQHKKAALPKLAYLPDEESDDPQGRRLSRTSFRKKEKSFVVDGGIADRLRGQKLT